MVRLAAAVLTASILSLVMSASAKAATLYNGTGLPADQAWLTYFATGGSQTATSAGPVTVDTTVNNAIYAGYTNYTLGLGGFGPLKNSAFPALERSTGYDIDFTLKINSDSFNRPERAGFSLLALSSDKYGIELGFHINSIFAQNRDFTNVDLANRTAGFNTTNSTDYRLRVLGDSYTLSSGGATIITGNLVDYFNTSSTSPLAFVYSQPNFLFLGDDTTSAGGSFTLGSVSVTPVTSAGTTAIPEPSLVLGTTVAAISLLAGRRQRSSITPNSK